MAGASSKIVDFSNVKDGGGGFNKKRIPSGDYLAVVTKVEDAESKSDGTFQYLFTIKVKKYSQYAYPYYCKLQENQLWKLRNLLIAAGLNVPKKRMKLDPSKIVNKVIGVTMEDDEYEGKLQSVISSIFPASELSEGSVVDDDEDAEDQMDDEGDEDEADEEGGDQFDDMDRAALKAYLTAQDSDFKAKKSQTDDDLRELARAAGGDDEEDEEEEPEPAPKAKKGKKKAAASDDELEELDISDL